jgi:hypothetical protein
MLKQSIVWCALLIALTATPRPAAADWLLTGFVSPLFNVKTSESATVGIPGETFDNSVGFGVNLASAFPSRGNVGFELDWGWYPKGLQNSDVFGTLASSRLMSVSTNFFYSPSVIRARPYVSFGPNFGYRSDRDEATVATASGWAVGINGGGGVMVFANEHIGGRVDVRYYRNFGDFFDLRPDATIRRSGWNELQFIRLSFGATVVLR